MLHRRVMVESFYALAAAIRTQNRIISPPLGCRRRAGYVVAKHGRLGWFRGRRGAGTQIEARGERVVAEGEGCAVEFAHDRK